MPELYYPTSDTSRLEVLRNAKNRLDQAEPGEVVLSAATVVVLNSMLPNWEREVRERDVAAGGESQAASALRKAGNVLRMYISHFLQAFNNAVARGEFSPAERAKFQLPVSQESVPTLANEADLVTWGDRLIKGEADRLAATLSPVTMPPIAAVNAKYQAFLAARTARDDAAKGAGKESEDVTKMREGVDEFIREDLWYEIVGAFRKEQPAAGRRKARLWGVRYRFRPGETPEEGELADVEEAPVAASA